MQTNRYRVRMLVLLLGSLLAASAWAQMPPPRSEAPNSDPATDFADADVTDAPLPPDSDRDGAGFVHRKQGHEHASAIPWSQLSNDQRSMLAPLQSQWDQLAPRRQQRLAERSQEWSQLPPERRLKISDRLQRWAQMSPEQRQAAARGAHRFRNLSDADRQRLMDTYRRFQELPPEQRRALLQKWRAQHASERGMRGSGSLPDKLPPNR
jgi:hypothetical protein